MKKLNLFLACISALFTLICTYFAFTKANVNPLSISLFIFVGIGATYLYLDAFLNSVKRTNVYYQVHEGMGVIGGNFDTAEEAINYATKFKSNPRLNNQNMTATNVAYWASREYVIKKHIHVIKTIKTI